MPGPQRAGGAGGAGAEAGRAPRGGASGSGTEPTGLPTRALRAPRFPTGRSYARGDRSEGPERGFGSAEAGWGGGKRKRVPSPGTDLGFRGCCSAPDLAKHPKPCRWLQTAASGRGRLQKAGVLFQIAISKLPQINLKLWAEAHIRI